MSNNKKGGIFGKGYYIALILCAAAIGISGYMYYRNANETQTQLQEPATDAISASQPDEDVAAVATQPQQTPGTIEVKPSVTEPATKPTQAQSTMKTGAPVSGQTVSAYAMDCLSYNETTRDWRVHNGVDIAAEEGTEVCAAADGTVYTTFNDDTMGMTVVIRHDGGYVTTYSSLDKSLSVEVGDSVKAGDVIGCVGASALLESALGDHVHFSVSCNGASVDPLKFLGQD